MDDDHIILFERFQTFYGKTVESDEDRVEMRMLLDNLLKIEAKTRKQNSNFCGKLYVQQKLAIIGVIPKTILFKYL